MQRIIGVIGTAAIAVTLAAGPATGLSDKKPNPATRRACENFTDATTDASVAGRGLSAREARALARAFNKKGVPKSVKRAVHAWIDEYLPDPVLNAQQEIDVLSACARAGVRE